jgi:hypothetical protein
MEKWRNGVLECWSVGVLECWCAGVLVCWPVEAPIAWRQTDHRTRKPHHSNTPILRCSVALSLLQLLSFDLRVMRARFGS